ncbi:hypothetical protein CGU37_21555 [Pseudomonas fluorescens]|nr:hypothetical protein CGU36_19020 [Pseudomonas fluorescens]OZO46956.1 hypothetical protein CGU37_21555 [Pseudomonas fluorescens]TGY16423.1 ThiF family adenylyltransferase [Pseudomonas fluorescens]
MNNFSQEFCLFDSSGDAKAIVAPCIFHATVDGNTVINGPAGAFQATEQSLLALEQTLRQAGALVPGSPGEVQAVYELLQNSATSRTTSFFPCKAKKCADLLSDVRAITNSKVLIIGCGGIGSSIAVLLAGSGVGHLTLVDADIIEHSNLNRQLFWRKKDVGKTKVSTLQREIHDRFDNINIQAIEKEVSYEEIIKLARSDNFSAIAITADNPPTLVSRAGELSAALGIPVVSGGYLHSKCVANFFSGREQQHIDDTLDHNPQWKRLPHSIMPSFGPVNFNIAALLALGVITSIASALFGTQCSHYIEWDAVQLPLGYVTRPFDENEDVV